MGYDSLWRIGYTCDEYQERVEVMVKAVDIVDAMRKVREKYKGTFIMRAEFIVVLNCDILE